MKKIHSTQDPLLLGHLKNALQQLGIECVTRNEYLTTGAGEIPPIECWLELWIVDDDQEEAARRALARLLSPVQPASAPWTCPTCGEKIEPQFSECWKCLT